MRNVEGKVSWSAFSTFIIPNFSFNIGLKHGTLLRHDRTSERGEDHRLQRAHR